MNTLCALRATGLTACASEPYVLARSLSCGIRTSAAKDASAVCPLAEETSNTGQKSSGKATENAQNHDTRIGGPVKALQPWAVLQRVDMRVGTVKQVMLPQDMHAKYKKISAPVFAVWSDFGAIDEFPYSGEWGDSSNLITAAKIRSFYSAEALNSGNMQMVGLVNAGVKQIGKLSTYYLLTGAYVDESTTEHNVARAKASASLANGSRLTILSLQTDGSRYEQVPVPGGPLRDTLDFMKEFVNKVDARVGRVTSATKDADGTFQIEAHFGDSLSLRSRIPACLRVSDTTELSDADGGESLIGLSIVGMVNVEPVDGNTFMMLGFVDDGCAVPVQVDNVGVGLPPLGARIL